MTDRLVIRDIDYNILVNMIVQKVNLLFYVKEGSPIPGDASSWKLGDAYATYKLELIGKFMFIVGKLGFSLAGEFYAGPMCLHIENVGVTYLPEGTWVIEVYDNINLDMAHEKALKIEPMTGDVMNPPQPTIVKKKVEK